MHRLRVAVALVCTVAACAGAQRKPPPPRCPVGDVVVQTDEEAAALAPCRAIEGTLTIGPSMALTSLRGLDRVARVGGALVIRGNLVLTGAYLPALVEAGQITIEDNRLLETASLHRVRVARGVVVRRNRALELLDLGALETSRGAVELHDNPRLDMVDLGQVRERPPSSDGRGVPR